MNKKILALAVAAVMALQTPMVALAADSGPIFCVDGQTHNYVYDNIDGQGEDKALTVANGSTANVTAKHISTPCYNVIQIENHNNCTINITVDNIDTSSSAAAAFSIYGSSNYVEVLGAYTQGKTAEIVGGKSNGEGVYLKDTAGSDTVIINGNVSGKWGIKNNSTDTANTVTVTGNVTGFGYGIETKGGTIAVTGTVKSTGTENGDTAIYGSNGATVTAGSVEANQGNAVRAYSGSTVTVNGDVKNNSDLNSTISLAKDASQQNCVTVNGGNVISSGTKAAVDNEQGTLIVKKGDNEASGNVISSNNGSATLIARKGTTTVIEGTVINNGLGRGIYSIDGATIEAGGIQAVSGTAIKVAEAGTIIVLGDVEAKNGIIFDDEDEIAKTGDAVIAINGELKVSDTAINAQSKRNADNAVIYVYGVSSNGDSNLVTTDAKYDKANLNYIIHGSDGKADYSNIAAITGDTLEQTIEIDGDKYYSSKQGTVSVTLNDGYELSTGATIISVNGNTYVVNVPEGGHVTLAAVKKAIQQAEEQAEQRASFTGSADNAVTNGQWNMGPGGYWTFRTDGIFKDTWGNITLENGKTGWFWFDKNGVMATGWKEINGKWYYFNEAHDGTYGMMLSNTTTPDGKRVGADGALIQ